jgi:hypothetical protein
MGMTLLNWTKVQRMSFMGLHGPHARRKPWFQVCACQLQQTFQLLRVENAMIAAGIKHLVLHHTAHMGWLVWCRVLHANKQDDRE